MKNTNTSLIAQALVDNREFKSARISAKLLGDYALARKWQNAVKALRIPAYRVAAHRHDAMGDTAENAVVIDQTPLYTALRTVLDLIGEVNGEKLNVKNCAEAIIAEVHRYRVVDITPEMAHARAMRSEASKAVKEAETDEELAEANSALELWKDECKRLESEAGNCKKVFEAQTESAFVNRVEMLLGDAISGQLAKTAEEVEAEMLAKAEARKAARKAHKKSARVAKAKAESEANTEAEAQA